MRVDTMRVDTGGYEAGRAGERRVRCRRPHARFAAYRLHLQPGGSGVHPKNETQKQRTVLGRENGCRWRFRPKTSRSNSQWFMKIDIVNDYYLYLQLFN